MKVTVKPGAVRIAGISVRRHTGGIYTVQISTPFDKNAGVGFGSIRTRENRIHQVLLYPEGPTEWEPPTRIDLTPTDNDEEEGLSMGLFDVLDSWSRYAVTLIAVSAAVLEESENVANWEPAGSIDYLDIA